MKIAATNNYLIIKAGPNPNADRAFEVVDSGNFLSEVVASDNADFKVGDIIIAGPAHHHYSLEGVDYAIVRADEVMGVANV